MKRPEKIVLIGVGNTLRSDDGVGAFICSQIGKLNFPTLTILIVQQLHVEILEDLLDFDAIIIVDASVTGNDVDFSLLATPTESTASSSHRLNASTINALIKAGYHKNIPMYLCAVRVDCFDMGEQLSVMARTNANKAIQIVAEWVAKQHLNYE